MAAPSNDNKASAAVISGQSGSVTGTLADATLETDESTALGDAANVWYAWTAPFSGGVVFSTAVSDASVTTLLTVYKGSNVLGASYGVNGTSQGAVLFLAVQGETYYLSVGGYSAGGDFTLSWKAANGEWTYSEAFNTVVIDIDDIPTYYDGYSVQLALFAYGESRYLDIPSFTVSVSPEGVGYSIYSETINTLCPSTGEWIDVPALLVVRGISRNSDGGIDAQQMTITLSEAVGPAMVGIGVYFNIAS